MATTLVISDDYGFMKEGEHEEHITFEELQKVSQRVQMLAEMLWHEIREYEELREQYNRQEVDARMTHWESLTDEEKDKERGTLGKLYQWQTLPQAGGIDPLKDDDWKFVFIEKPSPKGTGIARKEHLQETGEW